MVEDFTPLSTTIFVDTFSEYNDARHGEKSIIQLPRIRLYSNSHIHCIRRKEIHRGS
jgi:hypothetical protein